MDARLGELVADAMREGHNQYAPMPGLALLQQAIASRLEARYGLGLDPQQSVTITLGATEAIFSAIQALVGAGDEAIVFDPAYDSYDPAVRWLAPDAFTFRWSRRDFTMTGTGCARLSVTGRG